MKKMMVIAALMAIAATANAGNVVWGIIGTVEAPTTAYDLSGVTAALWVDVGGGVFESVDTAVGADGSGYFGPHDDADYKNVTGVNQVADADDWASVQAFKIILTTADGMYSYTFADGEPFPYEYVTDKSIFMQYMISDTDVAAGDWVAAPEPTSGLLLLIGVAGLALRRRRA